VIDDGLPHPWPPEPIEAASAFEQGDLVERPPFFYWADLDYPIWDMTVTASKSNEPYPLIELDAVDSPPFGIITSQSCDIAEVEPRKPWLQLAPVYGEETFAEQDLAMLRAQKYRHLFSLPPLQEGARRLVADLRLEFPVEKSWLVVRRPIKCMPDLLTRREFARKLATIRARPALDGPAEAIVRHLRLKLKRASRQNRSAIHDDIPSDGLRAKLISTGDAVTGIQIHVVGEHSASDKTRQWFDRWVDRLVGDGIVPGDFDFLGVVFSTLDEIDARTYRSLIELDLL
jgi:hypothetical protein